jgi:hypothetical protein
MAQHHVDLLGDLAAALMEVPEEWSVSLSLTGTMSPPGDRAWAFVHPTPDTCEHEVAATAAKAVRGSLAQIGHSDRADWFAEAYEPACK